MNHRVDTLIQGRRERLQRLLLRPLEHPGASEGSGPLTADTREHLLDYAKDLYWNEFEWENITAEEETDEGPVPELVFTGLLAFVRGLLLVEALPGAKALAEPRPEVVQDVLRFLAGRIVEFEEALASSEAEDPAKLRESLSVTDRLLDLVLYRYHDLTEAEVERIEEARAAATG